MVEYQYQYNILLNYITIIFQININLKIKYGLQLIKNQIVKKNIYCNFFTFLLSNYEE
jgi:hypothetical protein